MFSNIATMQNESRGNVRSYDAGVRDLFGSRVPPRRIGLNDRGNAWTEGLKDQADNLMKLEAGWDGASAQRISFHTLRFVFEILEAAYDERLPVPFLVPVSDGGVQIEWHVDENDLELKVERPNRSYGWYTDGDGIDQEEDFNSDFTVFGAWVSSIGDAISARDGRERSIKTA